MIYITLPLPPSDNRRFVIAGYGRFKPRLVLSPEYREYKRDAQMFLLRYKGKANLTPSYEKQLVINYRVFLKDKKRDGSNVEKCLKDVMTGYIYDDDKWVLMRLQSIIIDEAAPRVEVEIFTEVEI